MGKCKRLNLEEIGRIKELKAGGLSNRKIAQRIGRSPRVINNFFSDPERYGKNQTGGIKTATTERERRAILREAANSSLTARQIGSNVGTSASVWTIRRILKSSPTLKRLRLKKKPVLTPRHQEGRLNFAREHMSWNSEWRSVIFSDEKRFCLDGPDGHSYYYHDLRKERRYLSRHHSRQGSVMIWGAISYYGQVHLAILEGKQTGAKYKQLLQETRPHVERVMQGTNCIFQHDRAPIHTSRIVQDYFREENIALLDWPSISPDLNIIENLWGWLTRQIYANGRQFHSKEQLIVAIREKWNEIPLTLIRKLFDSIPNRIFETINVNGKHTHY